MPKLKGRTHNPVEKNGVLLLGTGDLAKQTGETLAAIRYWTKYGLIEVEYVSNSGYRFYSPTVIETVKKIRHLQKVQYLSLRGVAERLGIEVKR